MKIRNGMALINGDKTEYEFESNDIDIIADDGRTLFGITLVGNVLHIDAGNFAKHENVMLDDRFVIIPKAANCIELEKIICSEV